MPTTPTNPYPAGTTNHTLWNMMHITKGPGSAQAIKDYSAETGIDVNNHNAGFQIARYLLPSLYPALAQQQLFANSLQGYRHNTVNSALAQLMDPNQGVAQYRDKANAAAGSTLQSVLQRLKSGGAGIGAQQGAMLSSANQANTAGNMFQAQQDSPEGRMQRMQAILGLIASQNPDLANLMNLNAITQGTPRGQSGLQSAIGMIGQLGQMYTSAQSGGLFGAGRALPASSTARGAINSPGSGMSQAAQSIASALGL